MPLLNSFLLKTIRLTLSFVDVNWQFSICRSVLEVKIFYFCTSNRFFIQWKCRKVQLWWFILALTAVMTFKNLQAEIFQQSVNRQLSTWFETLWKILVVCSFSRLNVPLRNKRCAIALLAQNFLAMGINTKHNIILIQSEILFNFNTWST